ncbi:glycosyltransferase family 4 protein [Flavisolibacter nicotianae]|uniref:glycosyltransferase family 4 protein n=1 Tax=Flavisolibacter nicotianae TaxID=2364882 RepID=UPI000EB37513|nr:glycosyltransferase family 4 protein [Flavisolibacter nicotianae]
MMGEKPTIILIENSVSFTGAFKSALQQAMIQREDFRIVFVLDSRSTLSGILEEHGFRVYKVPLLEIRKDPVVLLSYLPRLWRNAKAVKEIIAKEKASIVIVNDFYNMVGVLIKRMCPAVRLVTYVRFLPETQFAPLRKIWTRLGQKYSDRMLAVSDAVLKQLPEKSNTLRLYNAVDFKENLPPKRWIKSPVTSFLYLGNYIKGKGHDYALQAFEKAFRQNPAISLVFAGGDMGLEKNRRFKQSLLDFAAQHQISHAVRFLSFASDVETLIKSADVVLNFSEAESFSMTVAEACYFGLPVIATRCGGPEEIIVDGETGLLVANRNLEEMTAAMVYLSRNPALQKTFGEAGKKHVREKFSLHSFAAACSHTYESIIGTTGH